MFFLLFVAAVAESLGPYTSDLIVTFHVIVRPAVAATTSASKKIAKAEAARSCWCVVC